jgi:hypothetical protein
MRFTPTERKKIRCWPDPSARDDLFNAEWVENNSCCVCSTGDLCSRLHSPFIEYVNIDGQRRNYLGAIETLLFNSPETFELGGNKWTSCQMIRFFFFFFRECQQQHFLIRRKAFFFVNHVGFRVPSSEEMKKSGDSAISTTAPQVYCLFSLFFFFLILLKE